MEEKLFLGVRDNRYASFKATLSTVDAVAADLKFTRVICSVRDEAQMQVLVNEMNLLLDRDQEADDAQLWAQVRDDVYKFRWLLNQARKAGHVPNELPRFGFKG